MARTFMVYVNADEMNASLAGCFTEQDKAQWVGGFQAGCAGAIASPSWPVPAVSGHGVGYAAFQRSEEYRNKKSAAGSRSAESRAKSSGTAQPKPNTPRTLPEHCSSNVQAVSELSNIQYPISNSDNPKSTSQPVAEDDLFSASPAEIAKATAPPPKPITDPHNWLDWRRDHPQIWINRSGEDGDLEAWKHLWGTYNTEAFSIMYTTILKTMPPGKRIGYGQAAEWLSRNCE